MARSRKTEQFIVSELRDSGELAISLVAERDGRVVGHVAVSPVTVSDGARGWYGLGPVSVAPDHQGQGIGTRLIECALRDLRALGAAGCVVLGNPRYYARFGFQAESSLVLPGVAPENFQAIAFAGSPPTGVVAYHDSFSARG